MVFGLGFLSAGLLTLLFLPAFWRRAVRLSRRRLEMLMPLSMDEIVAERDQLRAQFAVERRRMEQAQEAAQETRARDMAELGRRAAALAQAQTRLEALQRALDAGQSRISELEAALESAQAEGQARVHRLDEQGLDDAALRRALAAVGDDMIRLTEKLGVGGLALAPPPAPTLSPASAPSPSPSPAAAQPAPALALLAAPALAAPSAGPAPAAPARAVAGE